MNLSTGGSRPRAVLSHRNQAKDLPRFHRQIFVSQPALDAIEARGGRE